MSTLNLCLFALAVMVGAGLVARLILALIDAHRAKCERQDASRRGRRPTRRAHVPNLSRDSMKRSKPTYATLLIVALALAACASRPKPDALSPSAAVDGPAQGPEAARAAVQPPGLRPWSQADLAATAGERVFFALDSHALSEDARATLERQAAWLVRYPDAKAVIAGHADERGTREYNLALGSRRAAAARDYLVARGVASSRLRTVSYGKERPIDPRSNEEAWARNRNANTVLLDVATASW
jgi:peptidoglycan-associated lipoprotein